MLDADQPRDMIDMVDHVGDGRRLLAAHEHAHARYAHPTALGAQRLDRLVGLPPWMIDNRAAVAVGDSEPPRRQLHRLSRGPAPAMGPPPPPAAVITPPVGPRPAPR